MEHVLLRLLAPHAAVLVFWCWLGSAWGSILAYHSLILLLSRRQLAGVATRRGSARYFLLGPPCLVVGPLVYALLPSITTQPIDSWLTAHGLSGPSRWWMVPYFGLVHPVLEQAHWSSLRKGSVASSGPPAPGTHAPAVAVARARSALPHLAFAGYHMLVLASLLHVSWLWISFGVLVLTSVVWRELEKAGGLALPVLTHILVDTGLVLAAVWRAI